MPRYSKKQKAALEQLMRDDVYREAMKVIDTGGFASLTMERIAQGVGVSRATLYNYFADRDAVLDFLNERTFAPVEEEVLALAEADLPPEHKLRKVVELIFEKLHEHRSLVVAVHPETLRGPHRARKSRRRQLAVTVFAKVIRDGTRSGSFRKISPRRTAEIIYGAIAGLVETMADTGDFPQPRSVTRNLLDFMLDGLRTRAEGI